MSHAIMRYEETKFIFMAGKLRASDFIAMKKQGWRIVGNHITKTDDQQTLITLVMRRIK